VTVADAIWWLWIGLMIVVFVRAFTGQDRADKD